MKKLNFLFAMFMAMVLMTACQKEKTDLVSTEMNLDAQIQQDYEDYIAEHGEVQIEYTTLEKLNEVYIENGLPPVTLEELGVTEEEYSEIRNRVLINANNVEARCNSFYWYLIDMNLSGTATGADLIEARKVILNRNPPSPLSERFGSISWHWLGINYPLTTHDMALAHKMILRVIPPC